MKRMLVILSVPSAASLPSPGAQWLSSEKYGAGRDGVLTVSSTQTDSPIDSSCYGTRGTKTLFATNPSFGAGQIILIHQTRGSGAGNWELNVIDSYAAGTISTKYDLTHTYTDSGASQAQVLVLRQYSSVTVNDGATLTAKAWDGNVGGILAFLCKGTATIAGSISSSGKGFLGGAWQSAGNMASESGESGAGPRLIQLAANGSGGGGGFCANGYVGGGGGGGGYATRGGNGQTGSNNYGQGWVYDGLGGTGGGVSGAADLSVLLFGGGGGMGGTWNLAGLAGSGGNGGGVCLLIAKSVSISGSILAEGQAGNLAQAPTYWGSGGGGGAGGSILVLGHDVAIGTGMSAAGGAFGAAGNGGAGPGANGGAGGVGRIAVRYNQSFSGSSSPSANVTQDGQLLPNSLPNAPSNPSLSGGVVTTDPTPRLTWVASDLDNDPLTNLVTISAQANLSSPIVDDQNVGTNTSYEVGTPLAPGTYYWRVRSHDGTGYNTNSAVWSFVIVAPSEIVPPRVNYQGRLLDSGGQPVNGSVSIMARLYGQSSGGTASFTQNVGSVTVQNGIYQFEFGGAGLTAALGQSTQWLEVAVNGTALTPRQQLQAVPYAAVAGTVQGQHLFVDGVSGHVGVGTQSPDRKFKVVGDAGGTTAWYNDSDGRLKENVETIPNALDLIQQLRGVRFDWKDTSVYPEGRHLGLIAQEVEQVVPEVVATNGDHRAIATSDLVPLLIEAIKEQQQQINALRGQRENQ